jgi:hypothetical protein
MDDNGIDTNVIVKRKLWISDQSNQSIFNNTAKQVFLGV